MAKASADYTMGVTPTPLRSSNELGWSDGLSRNNVQHKWVMKNPSKPKPEGAWGMTVAAALDLLALVLLVSSDSELNLLILFGGCEILLILISVWSWRIYFESLIDYKVSQALDATKDKQGS